MTYGNPKITYIPFETSREILEKAVARFVGAAPSHALSQALTTHLGPQASSSLHIQYRQEANFDVCTWHHGAIYEYFVVGTIEALSRHCDLTSSEREHAMLTARKHAGGESFAIATSQTHDPVSTIHDMKPLRLLGVVIV